ncbi:MAG: NAD-dependent epimerase/dehydratase family protein [Sporocytophaga sp.]|uniref:NAD-dependent epimerase/dehydratase family protein n=1 Tax=Sporocytophaga sp. TaxID=2231183 RepID=UPI001AFF9F6A|nr:NAD-dependent epimerase/dehydratase family protein [Sporocytophaga sp.]MBO9701642.1 NAD-dependent epimerase/dehydratase family protein [Sporocytophaga sp.]
MKVLIIGSCGFIGRHLTEHYLKRDYEVFGIDLIDNVNPSYKYFKVLPNAIPYEKILKSVQPDYCFFAAGNANINFSLENPQADLEANTLKVSIILNAIKNVGLKTVFVNFSSAAVYGNPASLPVSEKTEIAPLSPYGWHKYMGELVCKEYSQIFGISTFSIRPFSVYGPGQAKLLLWDIYQKSRTGRVHLYGTGKESRDFIFIEDLLDAVDLIIAKGNKNGEAYNIANGKEYTIDWIASYFLGLADYKGEILFTQQVREGDPLNWRADINKIKELGYFQKISIESGLSIYLQWLKENM